MGTSPDPVAHPRRPDYRLGERHRHVWAFVGEPPALQAAYVQSGYHLPDFVVEQSDFSPVNQFGRLLAVPDDEYFAREGFRGDEVLEVPEMFEALLAQYERALPPTRERFLRSAYWHDRTRETWDVSASLCCVAAANAIEVVVPAVGEDRCPTCGLNRAPGPTRRFVQFVEQYALDIDAAARQDLYRLRSSLVHGDVLLDLDVPGPWGALVPRDFEQRDIIGTTLRAGRLGAINWLINAEVA